MATDIASEKLLREYEANVLDPHHKTLALWEHDRRTALFALLAQHDSHAITELLAPQSPLLSMGTTQVMKSLEEGLSQAVRWLHPGYPQFDVVPLSDSQLIEQARSYCYFASRYVDIADMHKMYGRGQITITLNKETKTVGFSRGKQGNAPLLGYAEGIHRIKCLPIARNVSRLQELCRGLYAKLIQTKFHFEAGRIVIDEFAKVDDPAIKELMEYLNPQEDMLLPDATDLIGFTLADFLAYYAILKQWSFLSTILFISLTLSGKDPTSCLPTQVVPRASFLDRMESLSGLSREKIEAITFRLTYDNRIAAPDIFQQPLICGEHSVAWSARVVGYSRQVRYLLKLMARTPATSDRAATIIGSRERRMLNELGTMFARRGSCAYKVMTSIAVGANEGEVDLLVYNWKAGSQLLLIEGKALLGVDEINEVDAATKEMQHAQKQLTGVLSILKALPEAKKTELFKFVSWDRVTEYFGIVVAQDAEPNDKYDHSLYPGISLATIKGRLRDNHFTSPRKFWEACKERRWLKAIEGYEETVKPVQVGDVTYELPVRLIPRAEPQSDQQKRR